MKLALTLFAILALRQCEAHFFTPVLPSNFDTKIVGGEESKPHSRPYQVALWLELPTRTAFCGGSLISANYVLTAAHCFQSVSSVEVVMGAHKLKENESTQVRMTATEFVVHKRWSMITMKNDIALIKLPQPVEFTDEIQPVTLPTRSDAVNKFEDYPCVVSGWGKDSDAATEVSPALREVHVPVLNQFVCALAYFGVIGDTHICTNAEGGRGTCNGDSGGPLVLEESGKQVGLVSFGLALGCELGWPSAYTRVSSYLDWIEENSDVKILN